MQILNQAVLLAGGQGTRLGKITKKIPKVLIKFENKPFLHYLIENLKINKINKITVLAGHKGNQIQKSLKKFKNVKVIIEKKPLGTGGALLNSFNLLDKKFLFLNGDSFFNINPNFINFSQNSYSFDSSSFLIAGLVLSVIMAETIMLTLNFNLTRTNQIVEQEVGFLISYIYFLNAIIFISIAILLLFLGID